VDHIIFFDQDSIPEDNLVTKLLEISTNFEIIDNKPNMVGPVPQDMRSGRNSYFLVKKSLGFINQFCNDKHSRAIECNFLISSGSLISSKIFEKIGNFRSDFFIDHVDTEFCTRMENAGFKMYGTCSTKIYHNLGDRIQKIWFGRWREISIHSPLRNYYMSRNTIYMTLYLPINLLWKIRIMRRFISYLIYSLFFTSPRRIRLKLFLLGAKHGFFKKLGKLKID
jgi:rhamnosyltransferase